MLGHLKQTDAILLLERYQVEASVRKSKLEVPLVLNENTINDFYDTLINDFGRIGKEEMSLLQVTTSSGSASTQKKELVCIRFY